jgi:hypothetical protein
MTYTEIDRLIAMLEPGADENTVLFVREQFAKQLPWATNDYVPRSKLDDEVFEPNDRSDQQVVDVWDAADYNPNDPRNW